MKSTAQSREQILASIKRAFALRATIDTDIKKLTAQLTESLNSPDVSEKRVGRRPGFKMSAAAKAKIAAAQRRRWARVKAGGL